MSINQVFLAVAAAVLLGGATPAQAGQAAPPPLAGTYNWSGTCIDCPPNGDPSPASATLVVPDVGDSSTWSFTFRSSNFDPDLVSTAVTGNFPDWTPDQPGSFTLIEFRSEPRDAPPNTPGATQWFFVSGLNTVPPGTVENFPFPDGATWALVSFTDRDKGGIVDNGWTYSPLSAVPEASSWVMALAGLGVLGPLLRRRRADSSAA